VDDDLLVLKSYRRALGKDHTLTFANDGEDALAVLELDTGFDVILCDLMMPNMDGPRFFEELTTRHPQLLDRVVFCSGGTFTPRAEDFLRQCRMPIVYKPVEPNALLDVLVETARKADASAPVFRGAAPAGA
jgi:CheY-like chemotaxis protein